MYCGEPPDHGGGLPLARHDRLSGGDLRGRAGRGRPLRRPRRAGGGRPGAAPGRALRRLSSRRPRWPRFSRNRPRRARAGGRGDPAGAPRGPGSIARAGDPACLSPPPGSRVVGADPRPRSDAVPARRRRGGPHRDAGGLPRTPCGGGVRARGARVVADTSEGFAAAEGPALLAALPRLDLFAPSREEVRRLLPGLDDEAAQRALDARCPQVVQKRGPDGMWWSRAGSPIHREPSRAREIADSTGAGDAAAGALAAGLARGLPVPELLAGGIRGRGPGRRRGRSLSASASSSGLTPERGRETRVAKTVSVPD